MDNKYEVIIQPQKNWFYFDWRGLIQHRDLLYFLVRVGHDPLETGDKKIGRCPWFPSVDWGITNE